MMPEVNNNPSSCDMAYRQIFDVAIVATYLMQQRPSIQHMHCPTRCKWY